MRRLGSLGLAMAVSATIIFAGAGAAYAATSDCVATTGARVCWNETTHVMTIYDTLSDGDTAYAGILNFAGYYEAPWGTTGGAGTYRSVPLSGMSWYDIG